MNTNRTWSLGVIGVGLCVSGVAAAPIARPHMISAGTKLAVSTGTATSQTGPDLAQPDQDQSTQVVADVAPTTTDAVEPDATVAHQFDPDVNGDGLHNVTDFVTFHAMLLNGDLRANCDKSLVPPVLNVADFSCFMQRFAAAQANQKQPPKAISAGAQLTTGEATQ